MTETKKTMSRYPGFARRFMEALHDAQTAGVIPKITQRSVGKFFGVSEITARNWMTGEKLPGMDNARLVAHRLGISVDWLLGGDAPKRTGSDGGTNVTPFSGQQQKPLPLISWQAALLWAQDMMAGVREEIAIEDRIVAPRQFQIGERGFWLRVEGNSMMAPAGHSFPDGTLIAVDPDTVAENSNLVIAIRPDTGEPTFRVYRQGERISQLEPLNPQYPALEFATDDIQIVGTVKGAIMQF